MRNTARRLLLVALVGVFVFSFTGSAFAAYTMSFVEPIPATATVGDTINTSAIVNKEAGDGASQLWFLRIIV